MEVRIRNAKLNEVKGIYVELLKPMKRTTYSKEMLEAMIKEKNSLCLVAEYNKKIIGVIAGRGEGKKSFWIYIIVVKKDFRKEGIGKLLVKNLFEKVKKSGGKRVATDTPNIEQAGFFKKMGFRIVGKIPKWYEDKDQLIMFKEL